MKNLLTACSFVAFLAGVVEAQTPLADPAHGLTPAQNKAWMGYGKTPSHSGTSAVPAKPLSQIRWSTPVDLMPQYYSNLLLIHYGSPLSTKHGTVVLPVKTGAYDSFQLEGRRSTDGGLVWTQTSDYILPPYNWVSSFGCTLTPSNGAALPGAGGTIYLRADAEHAGSSVQHLAFYGLANYQANPSAYDSNVMVDTPITCDEQGNLYFGFVVLGPTPLNLEGGLARISASGVGTWVSAASASGDPSMQKVSYNCAPALSRNGKRVYVAVNDVAGTGYGTGYLLALDSITLATLGQVKLKDGAFSTNDAVLPDDGTASPTVGPDGDVYFGVLENPFYSNHLRGWLLHFDGALSQTKLAGAFGWDDTASIVPASAVPSYTGPSAYLLLTKYNNYVEGGGDGANKVAVLDPFVSMVDPVSGVSVMKEVLTKAGPTPDPNWVSTYPNAVREWCINTAAVDPNTKAAFVGNEDGKLYRWDFTTNTLSEVVTLTAGIGEAYTPTIVGADGTVYAINDATLFAVRD